MKADECEWCKEYRVFKRRGGCTALHPERGFSCTRYAGHKGYHIACGIEDTEHPITIWSSDNRSYFNEN